MISFVVPAHDEEQLIGACLTAIREAAAAVGVAYEIVVVDDASTDRTASIATQLGARVERVSHRQISRTRNTGAAVAIGDPLVFVDADTIISPEVLRASLEAVREGCAGGGAIFRPDGRVPLYGRFLVFVTCSAMRAGQLVAGCYVFCTRAAFDKIGGFDETVYAAEDVIMGRGLKRVGPLAIVTTPVITSGRKMRSHSSWELVRLLGAFFRRGRGILHTREDLTLWYGGRRADPERESRRKAP